MNAFEPTIKGWHLKYGDGDVCMALWTFDDVVRNLREEGAERHASVLRSLEQSGHVRTYAIRPVVACTHKRTRLGLCYRDDYTPTGPTKGRKIKTRRS